MRYVIAASLRSQTTRNSYSTYGAGGPASNPQLWASVSESDDFTNTQSSRTNAQLASEFDLYGNNVDNANNRAGIVLVLGNRIALTSGGFPYEAGTGIGISTAKNAQAKTLMEMGGNYRTAALDFRNSSGNGGAGGFPAPTVTASSSGTAVAVSNVMPFTSDYLARDVNGGYTATVYINGTAYTETGYAFTGTGPAGTLTLASSPR